MGILRIENCTSPNKFTIGIIGGGQLGKMIAFEAKRMSFRVAILDPERHCPASSLADGLIVGSFKDEMAIHRLAQASDVLTYEIELTNSTVLEELQSRKYPVHPSPHILKIIQNKMKQKQFLKMNGMPTADFEVISSSTKTSQVCNQFGYPVILKACEDSYDGRGNFIINEEADIENGLEFFHGRLCMIEKFVPFTKEISVMVARNTLGQIESFPVVENIHAHGILTRTIAPARISKESSDKAVQIAKKLVKILSGAGIYGIEMFLKENGDILINEIAPRPHNSGHYSIDACSVSQFEQHIRAILGLPLSQPRLLSAAVMVNILGPDNFTGQYSICGFKQAANIQGLKLHIYGKDTSKPRRKLGHFTITAESVEEALGKADLAGKALIVEEFKNDKKFGEADSWNRNGK